MSARGSEHRAEHVSVHESIGAYVLGDLPSPLAARLEAHLPGCEECRREVERIGSLAGPLSSVDPDDELLSLPDVPVPAALDARMEGLFEQEAAREAGGAVVVPAPLASRAATRRRRWPVAGAALAGAVAAALVAVVVLPRDTQPEPAPEAAGVAVSEVSTSAGVHAEAWRVDHRWGVEITLRASGLRDGREYDVWVIDDEGHERAAGGFLGVRDSTVTCSVATSVLPAHASRLVVTGPAGKVVISAPIEA